MPQRPLVHQRPEQQSTSPAQGAPVLWHWQTPFMHSIVPQQSSALAQGRLPAKQHVRLDEPQAVGSHEAFAQHAVLA